MEVMRIFMITAVCFLYCDSIQCSIPLIPVAIGGAAIAGLGYMTLCHFKECCTDKYSPADLNLLGELLRKNLYGQPLAQEFVQFALEEHMSQKQPLAMIFYGSTGTGKNYVSDLIVKALYKEGTKSKYVHIYNRPVQFRSKRFVEQYKAELQESITKHLKACPRSILIFDRVDKIPKGTLDAIVPFLDYNSTAPGIDTTKAIFIFISSGTEIINRMLEIVDMGIDRNHINMWEFERLQAATAFNEGYGLHKSGDIESTLIDYYVPFLPLEKAHVQECIVNAFRRRNIEPNSVQIEEAMSQLTFGPFPHNLYSMNGCKELDQIVAYIIDDDLHYNKEILRQPDNDNDQRSTVEEKIDKVQKRMESMSKFMVRFADAMTKNEQELANIRNNLVTHKREIDALKSQFLEITKRETVKRR